MWGIGFKVIGCIGSRVITVQEILFFGKGAECRIHGVRAFGSQGTMV